MTTGQFMQPNNLLPPIQTQTNQSLLAQLSSGQVPANAIVPFGENYANGPVGGNTQATVAHLMSVGHAIGSAPLNQQPGVNPTTGAGQNNGANTPAPNTVAQFVGSISGTTLTVTNYVGCPTLGVGIQVTGPGVLQGTTITALGSGTGGNGTYTVNNTQTVGCPMAPVLSNGG